VYGAWLTKAAKSASKALHVVYINTSLRCKAAAQSIVPTITCTSSNVVQTILQAAAQVPDLSIWYGPDTYMGENLRSMFQRYASMSDSEIKALHPSHDQASVSALLDRFEVFQQGNCIVHHMFGDDIVKTVKERHPDAYVTAHLEVPGEMFELAMEAKARGRGAVGSTSNILSFITEKSKEAAQRLADGDASAKSVKFILGTESGMISSIVKGVQETLRTGGKAGDGVEVEIIFPVAADAVSAVDGDLQVVPGVPAGEGCSTAGGCATCPYMKMNDLEALTALAEKVHASGDNWGKDPILVSHLPRQLAREVAARGAEPILNMRDFMREGRLSDALVADVEHRAMSETDLKDTLQQWAAMK